MTHHGSNISGFYDKIMYNDLVIDLFEGSKFNNFGYWSDNTRSQKHACENLVEQLLSFFPEKKGQILDVACGMGGSTECLLKHYPVEAITAINLSAKQLKTCQLGIPEGHLVQMDAAQLAFADNSFDAILCIEATFHFKTRKDFLREALRVLRPGGYLALSDVLLPRLLAKYHPRIPEVNWLQTIDAYHSLCQDIGFAHIDIVDATRECWHGFRQHYRTWLKTQYQTKKITYASYLMMSLAYHIQIGSIRSYVLVSARKP